MAIMSRHSNANMIRSHHVGSIAPPYAINQKTANANSSISKLINVLISSLIEPPFYVMIPVILQALTVRLGLLLVRFRFR